MNNIIYTASDEAIGFYKDLKAVMVEETKKSVERGEYEQASQNCEDLAELEQLKDYEGLIIVSYNNGMGFTAQPLKEKK